MIGIGVSLKSLRSSVSANALKAYAANGIRPSGLLDYGREVYVGKTGRVSDSSEIVTYGTPGLALMTDSDGFQKWNPHNLALNSATPATQNITVVSGNDYTVEITGTGSVTLSGAGTGTVTAGSPVEVTASTTTLTLTVSGSPSTLSTYRSDQGGMAPAPLGRRIAGSETYVPTTSAAVYLPRENSYLYDAVTSSWVNNGLFLESEARTQLLHTTNALVTQSYTVTAVPHTLHFTGTGTVTLSGASTDGPLVGTGTGNQNRVSLTFTPTAASLTLTVSGTVTDAQLEVGATPSSYIPNLAASGIVTRAAQTAVIEPANNPLIVGGAMPDALSAGLKGKVTYVDNEGFANSFVRWYADSGNSIRIENWTSAGRTGQIIFTQYAATVLDQSISSPTAYSPGINVPFNIAFYHDITPVGINGAVDGTALTANTTPTALPDLSAVNFQIGQTFMGHIQELVLYSANVADAGLEEITS